EVQLIPGAQFPAVCMAMVDRVVHAHGQLALHIDAQAVVYRQCALRTAFSLRGDQHPMVHGVHDLDHPAGTQLAAHGMEAVAAEKWQWWQIAELEPERAMQILRAEKTQEHSRSVG